MDITVSEILDCYRTASEELQKITRYDIPTDFDSAYTHHSYTDGHFYEHTEGDRGEKYTAEIGSTKDEFVSRLLYRRIWRFALDYEVHHRRKFEDNRRQMNEIIECCYSFLDNKYEYTLMENLSDNIHIYFDLLDYYTQVSKNLLHKTTIPQETMHRIEYIALRHFAAPGGGFKDVAFAMDYVRYSIREIVKVIPVVQDEYLLHENQFDRLLLLEKRNPHSKDKYPLGLWDDSTFSQAEKLLQNGGSAKGDAVTDCALYLLINLLHNEQAEKLSFDLCFPAGDVLKRYRPILDELFIYDKYGVFFFGGQCNKSRIDKLDYKLFER